MEKRPAFLQILTLIVGGLLLVGALFWFFQGQKLLLSIFEGRFHPAIDELVRQHKNLDPLKRDFHFYLQMAESLLIRLSLLWGGFIGLIWLFWPHLNQRLRAFRNETVAPEQLAVFRILVFGVLLWYPNYTAIFRMSALPHVLIVAPPGWSSLLQWLPPTPALAQLTGSLYVLGSIGALIGYRTRLMALLATLSGLYFLGIPQFYGKIDHYHHILWFSTLAAFGPVSDRWSFDAWRKKELVTRPAAAYARMMWLIVGLLAIIYFFAGWWKIVGGGMSWIWGDGAWLHLETQAMRLGKPVPEWLADNTFLQSAIGLATLILELGWGYAVLSRRFRPWLLAVGLFFHGSIYWLMEINFWQLPVFYLIFLPWGELIGQKITKIPKPVLHKQLALRWVGGILILGNGLCGLAHLDSWPFAVYPSFGNPPESRAEHYYLVGMDNKLIVNVNLESDSTLRTWLPKTRLQGLHNQLLRASDSLFQIKLKQLVPLYLGALTLENNTGFVVMRRVIDLKSKVLITNELVARFDENGIILP